ncbi:MAG TPA: arginine--tRNA ligase [Gammaproteobacteria bacterium]|nr:arginine--tRNA ligase [Gammaproteobacteria bacterium]
MKQVLELGRVKQVLAQIFKTAIQKSFGEIANDCDPMIQLSSRKEFGDYQANFAMRLAKQLNKKPIEVAMQVVQNLNDKKLFKSLEPSGPGFINIFLNDEFLAERLKLLVNDSRLGIQKHPAPENVVVDYANANVAKEMHVGHIRSIVIGDAIVRILDFLGHDVIRQSHLGDWGTQFGMLIEYLFEIGEQNAPHAVSDLDPLYKKSKAKFDADPDFAEKARQRVVALQNGDAETLVIWNKLVKESLQYFQKIYEKLDVLITEEDARGESFYNPMLAQTVAELMEVGLAHNDEEAIVVPLEEFPIPYLIRKKDGGYLYATTDLAAAKFRVETLKAKRIIYMTDARQKQHFAMLFATLAKTKWLPENIRLEHIPFGAILGKDNKPFKTRSGELIKLITLLEEAEKRAEEIAHEKNANLSSEQIKKIAHDIGIGALKYADLRSDKIKDYVFDWEKLLSFEGNTAPYLQNAYVRIRAIFRKGSVELKDIQNAEMILLTEVEHALAIKILNFPDVIYSVSENLSLHSLCDYLYDLAATYHKFYENCPILSNEDKKIRDSRLLLSDLTAKTLQLGLDLLGIKTLELM